MLTELGRAIVAANSPNAEIGVLSGASDRNGRVQNGQS
jgi:hypothetical protein